MTPVILPEVRKLAPTNQSDDYLRREVNYNHRPTEIQARDTALSHRDNDTTDYSATINQPFARRPILALLIAAHNEELVLEGTIRSAINAGMQRQHIYVVDDNSTDTTSEIAIRLLGAANVIKVGRSGKGLALTKAGQHFQLARRYRWIHIADADGGFAPDYFYVFRRELRVKNAAATGYIRSLPGGPISQYRVYEYTIGMEIHRRFQAMTHTVPVIPGPTSCFRADVFDRVNFANGSITEDFDVTIQIHRNKLGNIQFIPEAVAYTQDPLTTRDYIKQITRWNRGILQGMRIHGLGKRLQRIDAYLSYQVLQNLSFFVMSFMVLPGIAYYKHSPALLAVTFLFDVLITLVTTIAVAGRTKRWDILAAFPHIFIMRWVSVAVFIRAFIDIMVLRRFRSTTVAGAGTWSTAGRRYKQDGVPV